MMDSARSPSEARQDGDRPITTAWLKPVAAFILLFGAVWLSLYAAHALLPFLRPGSVVIADAKFDTLVKSPMFGVQDRYRVMMFGYSKVLSGLRPRALDAALGPGFRSYNLGLPGDVRFLPILEVALAAGNIPTHVLLTIPWDGKREADGVAAIFHDDNALAGKLFPFRTLPRDAALFLVQNRSRLRDAVRDVDAQRSAMLDDRGWYFIKSQSHYPGDRLPDDYALPSDHSTRVERRVIPEKSLARDRLEQLARQYGFQVIFVPAFFRVGEAASWPAPDGTGLITISEHPLMRVLGPDYLTYPPALFADPQHMNPTGALVYTADLARLLKASGAFD
ncbi:hypothetical protein WHZ77_13095 [Bradyrhizobium sp. A5]|uniref:hypothetical protein n=1 Tax=Bradyrhizobium sp. A5 TaxID=3133696 RepID=UPI00324C62A2